jgi:hypothetical protein
VPDVSEDLKLDRRLVYRGSRVAGGGGWRHWVIFTGEDEYGQPTVSISSTVTFKGPQSPR